MRRLCSLPKLAIAATLFVFATGHGGSGCCSEPVLGPSTETVCPPSSTLTYENFGAPFMAMYCTDCHSSMLSGDDREGAPAYHDFDSQIGVQRVADHVDQAAGSGPAATNDQMPPAGKDQPTLEERQQLAEWIACGAL